jgi:NodT family efflux transporter outer membrane factor (OMF) lipoprotein
VAHGGQSAQLLAWWQQWNDALLVRLQDQAQQASPSVAAAATRVAQARHAVVASGAASGPALSASAGVARAVSYVGTPAATQASAGLNVSWEADLWGGQQASAHAADQRLQASQAQWHEARVAVAAEVARQYTQLRLCQQVLDIQRADAQSREVMARLSAQRTRAGFESPANAALAQASAAQGRMAVTQQHAQCEAALQGLVALSALTANDSASLSAPLDQSSGALWSAAAAPAIASASVQADPLALPLVLPAALLAQRPDVFAAQRSVAAASADVGSAQADRYPRLGLSGQITAVHTRGSGNDQTWSIGPLQISLPLWDGGRRASQVTVQQAAYDEAVVAYRASVRNAVREVEQALLALNSATARQADAAVATQGFERALQAAADRQRAGLGSLLELEDTRRSALAAQLALAQLHADRLLAWVDLYRAFGGGWSTAVATSLAVPHLPASSDQTPSPNPSIEATR